MWCRCFSLLLHAFARFSVNRCCLECNITRASVSPDILICADCWVTGSEPRMDLACSLRRRWRSSHLPTSLGSYQSLLPLSTTAWTHATLSALALSGTMPYISVKVCSVVSAAMGFVMYRLCSSLNVRCLSILTHSRRVACVMNRMIPIQSVIFAVSCS